MLGTVARGAYLVVLAALVVGWAISFNKEAPARAWLSEQVWDIHA